jgi:valyl-tRNA synthetase
MPFLTEELWQRLAKGNPKRPQSIALAQYPPYDPNKTDSAAEREIQILQDIITLARTLRTEMKLDPKLQLEGQLYAKGEALKVGRAHAEAIRKLANVNLACREEAAPTASAAMRSTPLFDLVLDVPKVQLDAVRKRLEKEKEQLEKNIGNSERQLRDEKFLGGAPPAVVDSLRRKLAEYQAQLDKVKAALDGLA